MAGSVSSRRIVFTLARLSPFLLLPALAFVLGTAFLPILLVPSLMLAPALLFRGDDSGPGGSGSDDGGGGGSGPRHPDPPPSSPFGGLLLPDAQPWRTRLRDHRPALRLSARRRRAAPEPARQPARAPARR
jgi:hypothetical protein